MPACANIRFGVVELGSELILLRAKHFSGAGPLRLPGKKPALRVKTQPPDEEARLREMLEKHRWSLGQTAEALGISRYALSRMMKKHGLSE